MLLQQEIRIGDAHGYGYAKLTSCDLYLEQTLFGYRLNFSFQGVSFVRKEGEPLTLIGLETDLYFHDGNRAVLMGRTLPDLHERPQLLNGHDVRIRRHFDIRTNDFIQLADQSHHGDVTFEFHATPVFLEANIYVKQEEGRLKIPHSEWLEHLNRAGMARYDLIAIRTPIASSHLHKPFAEAVDKIREAERQYMKGDWNGAAASCRNAWKTVLSTTPSGTSPFEHLLAPLIGDPKRKEFATVMMKGLHDILNKAAHLEGDVKTSTPPTSLQPEDALLCIHWYAAMIGYLSSLTVKASPSS